MIALWFTLVLIGLITFAFRFSLFFFLGYMELPAWLRQSLRFVPVAALTTIIAPEVLMRSGALVLTWQNERLVAGLLATVIAWWTRNIFLTITLGMVTLYALQWLRW